MKSRLFPVGLQLLSSTVMLRLFNVTKLLFVVYFSPPRKTARRHFDVRISLLCDFIYLCIDVIDYKKYFLYFRRKRQTIYQWNAENGFTPTLRSRPWKAGYGRTRPNLAALGSYPLRTRALHIPHHYDVSLTVITAQPICEIVRWL